MKAVGNEKQCSRCKRILALGEFAKNRSMPDGFQNWCDKCSREYRATNAEQRATYQRNYVVENRERVNEYQRKYRQEYPETCEAVRRRVQKYRVLHADRVLERERKWRADNPDKVKEVQMDYYARNQVARRANSRQWRQNNPDQVARQNETRRAREVGASVDEIDIKNIYKRDRDICYLCGKKVKKSERHLDHVIPLSRGGAHSEDNLRVTHARCNLIKGAKLVAELDMSRFR